jgi:hypothetical protein
MGTEHKFKVGDIVTSNELEEKERRYDVTTKRQHKDFKAKVLKTFKESGFSDMNVIIISGTKHHIGHKYDVLSKYFELVKGRRGRQPKPKTEPEPKQVKYLLFWEQTTGYKDNGMYSDFDAVHEKVASLLEENVVKDESIKLYKFKDMREIKIEYQTVIEYKGDNK